MFDLDLQSRTPIYEQLYKKIIELIIKGVIKEHDATTKQADTVDKMSQKIGISRKAYQELERNKIIYSVAGRGSFVSGVHETTVKEYIFEDFDKASLEALKAGITKDELKDRIDGVNI